MEDDFNIKDEDRVVKTIEDYEIIKERLIEIANRIATFHDYGHWDIDEDEVEIGPDSVSFRVAKWRCGDYDYESFDFPISYLWDEDWEGKEERAMDVREAAKRKQEEEVKQKRAAEREANERAQLEKLKAKYEGKDG